MKYYQEFLKCKYESLELTSPDEMLDCYSPQYIDLILIKDNQRKPIRYRRGDMSKLSDGNARVGTNQGNDSEYVSLSQTLDVEEKKKKTILIEGGPGMGKTTLAINICKCWAKDELLQNYNAVILLTLRDPEIQEAKTISDLLLIPDDEMRDSVFKEIMKSYGERICFIFEGFDELPNHLCDSPVFAKITEKLPKCMLIYTSRPHYFFFTNFSQIIKINGFTEKSIDEYILNAFESELDGQKMALELQSQVHNNPEIKKILYVPINVAIICLIFFHFSKLPKTLTELYTLLCLRLILRHIIKRTPNIKQVKTLKSLMNLPEDISKQFSELCYIGYKGMCSEKIIFSSEDLSDMNVIEDKISGLGLLMVAPTTSVYGIKKSYNFWHLTLQEFCAAWYISKLPTEKQIQRFNSYLNHDKDSIRSQMVWRFYSGITRLQHMEVLNSVWPCKSVISPHETDKLFVLMKLIYEAGNNLVCQMLGDCFYGNLDIELCDMDFFDDAYNVEAMSYFLKNYKGKLISINLPLGGYPDVSQLMYEPLKHRLLKNKTIFPSISKGLFLFNCFDLYDLLAGFNNSLKVDRYCVVEIHICGNYEEMHMEILSQILYYSKTLKVLRIESFQFGCKGALGLAECRNIVLEDFRLPSCIIGKHGAGAIGKMISCNKSIKSVNLRDNSIGDAGIKAFVHHLQNKCMLQFLNLENNGISEIGAIYLKEIMSTVGCLKLSGNPLGHIGIYLTLETVMVPMKCIELSHRDTSYVYRSVAAILDKVESISFVAPEDVEGCNTICKSLVSTTMLMQLKIGIYTIDLNHHKLLLNAIGKNNNIKALEISYKYFTYEYAECLAGFIKNNKSLRSLSFDCSRELSPQGFLLIADALTENTTITYMKISNDRGLYDHNRMEENIVLEFLYQLKQADSLKQLILWISLYTEKPSFPPVLKKYKPYQDGIFYIRFYRNVDMSVLQINYARSIKGIDPLKLNIDGYIEKDY